MTETRKPRVLVVTSTFRRWEGDHVPGFVDGLCAALTPHADVHVLAPHAPGAATEEALDGMTVHRFRYAWPASLEQAAYGSGMRDNLARSWTARLSLPVFVVAQMAALWRLIRSLKPDVVHSHWLIPQGLAGAVITRLTGRSAPHVVTVHAADFYALRPSRAGRLCMRTVLRGVDAVVSVSRPILDEMQIIAHRVLPGAVFPMGIDPRSFDPKQRDARGDATHFVFVGRFVEKKGATYLLDAFHALTKSGVKTHLTLVGDGPLRATLEERVRTLGLTDTVTFTGAAPTREVAEHLRAADCLVTPSIVDARGETEGMPVVILEAFASGIPVIASTVSGIPDVVQDNENGLLVQPAQSDALADAMRKITDAGTQSRLAHGARAGVQQYTWDTIAENYVRIYQDLMGVHRVHGGRACVSS